MKQTSLDLRTLFDQPKGYCLIGALVSLSLVGCSDQPVVYPVRGHVLTSDGSPVEFGLLEFRNSASKLNARARIQADGSFQLTTFKEADGAVAGTHQAIIVQQVVADMPRPHQQTSEHEHVPKQHREHRFVDRRFANYETSPLVFVVEPKGENVISIEVH